MGKIYIEKQDVKLYACDRLKKMRITMLLRELLHVSAKQTYQLYGNDTPLDDKGLSWFIIQQDINISRLPLLYEEIIIETEALNYNQYFTYRQFRVYSQKELLVEVLAKFAMVDKEKRKIVRIDADLIDKYQSSYTKEKLAMSKVTFSNKEITEQKTFNVNYMDIDSNQHVNNAVYLDWMLESLSEQFLLTHEPTKISIVYQKELVYGASILSKSILFDNYTEHEISDNNNNVCLANIHWKNVVK